MTIEISRKLAVAITSIVVGSTFVATYGCEQELPKCSTGRGAFAAKYTLVSGPDSCAELKGEKLGLQTYNARGENDRPNLDSASIAIQAEGLGVLVDNAALANASDPDTSHKAYALGAFTTNQPVGNFCTVSTLTPAVQELAEVKEDPDNPDVVAQPATSVTYAWSNVRVYVTASAYGTQFTGDLVRTQDGVDCTYKVAAIYPYVDCSAPDPNDETAPPIADVSLCAAEPDPDHGHPTGSGINPDFPVECDPELLACTLTKDVPALK